jgi:amino acid transporter
MASILSRLRGLNKKVYIAVGVSLLVIIALLVVVSAAFTQTTPAAPSASTSVFASSTPSPTPTPAANQPAADLFAVPELGLKFAKTDQLSDLAYVIKTVNGRPAAYFSSARVKAAGGAACGEANGPVGILSLDPTTSDNVDEVTTIGSDYLNFDLPNAPCSTNNKAIVTAAEQAQALRQALDKVTFAQ